MTSTLVDTNIIIDVLGPESATRKWSVVQLARVSDAGSVHVNQVIYRELAAGFTREIVQRALDAVGIERDGLSFEAAWRAGTAHGAYRRAGGARARTLPDFLIGAQALVEGHSLLTRDPSRYRSYFPELNVIAPDTHP
jgi:predicted nucleic acid-binding protein